MSAVCLPLELQQQVFSFLDTTSFYAARKTCRWWRYASNDTVTLSRQLKKLPISPPANAYNSTPLQLQRLFNEAAHTLLVNLDLQRQTDDFDNASDRIAGKQTCVAATGDRQVSLNDRMISLYDTSYRPAKLLTQRPQNDLEETVGSGPWLRVNSAARVEMALSSDSTLLAVAQERTIQIYNLSDEPDSFTINEYIPSAAGHSICGLSFEQNDRVLRVCLSGKGSVVYLGTPMTDASSESESSKFDFWKSKAGLRHAFLDTSRIALPSDGDGDDDYNSRLSGLQLLRPLRDGWLFAAQSHGGDQCSRYVLGHIRASAPEQTLAAPTTELDSVTILADLHSYLSSWAYNLNAHPENGMGMYEYMPTAHEHHPVFALNEKHSLLALGEWDKKCVRPKPLTTIFLYRLPSIKTIEAILAEKDPQTSMARKAGTAKFLDRLEAQQQRGQSDESVVTNSSSATEQAHKVGRLPVCLATVLGGLTDLTFTDGPNVELVAKTADCTRTWKMSEV